MTGYQVAASKSLRNKEQFIERLRNAVTICFCNNFKHK